MIIIITIIVGFATAIIISAWGLLCRVLSNSRW